MALPNLARAIEVVDDLNPRKLHHIKNEYNKMALTLLIKSML
jgi:hypothetical protein